MSEYVVLYEQAEDGGLGAYLPDVPGVNSLGETRSEVEELMKEALSAHVDYLRERGQGLPDPVHQSGMIRA